MDFDFTEDQESLRDAVRRWVDKGYGFERRKSIVKAGGFSREAWGELGELGLLGLAVPEAQGGMGFGATEAMVVMEELGRGLVLEPFAAVSLVAAPLLASSTAPSAALWQQGVAEGKSLLVLAHQERAARYKLAHVETTVEKDGAGNWLITGKKSIVPAGEHADAYLVPARVSGAVDDPDGIALFLVSRGAGVKVRGYPTQDGACAAEVEFDRASGIEALPAGPAFGAIEAAIDRGIAALAAEAVGIMDKLFAVTLDYLNTRKQFGVPIGTFQALRHRVADVKMQLELARSMCVHYRRPRCSSASRCASSASNASRCTAASA